MAITHRIEAAPKQKRDSDGKFAEKNGGGGHAENMKKAGIGYLKPNPNGGHTGRIRQDDSGNVKRKLVGLGYKKMGNDYVHSDGSKVSFEKVPGMAQFRVVVSPGK